MPMSATDEFRSRAKILIWAADLADSLDDEHKEALREVLHCGDDRANAVACPACAAEGRDTLLTAKRLPTIHYQHVHPEISPPKVWPPRS